MTRFPCAAKIWRRLAELFSVAHGGADEREARAGQRILVASGAVDQQRPRQANVRS
jgi:hypothetical protein